MTAPHPTKQREAWNQLDRIFLIPEHIWVIHYSCENFYNRAGGQSPRINSIVLRNLKTGQAVSFSIHLEVERKKISRAELSEQYNNLEKDMLNEYFEFLTSRQNASFLHWNMRDANYGFVAIEHRFQVLNGNPFVVPDQNKIDLSRLLVDIYGRAYVGHPRLESLMKLNAMEVLNFLSGEQEAEAFEAQKFHALHQSTLRKTHVLAKIAENTHHRQLKTNTTWWQMRGGRVRLVLSWLATHWVISLFGLILAAAGVLQSLF